MFQGVYATKAALLTAIFITIKLSSLGFSVLNETNMHSVVDYERLQHQIFVNDLPRGND